MPRLIGQQNNSIQSLLMIPNLYKNTKNQVLQSTHPLNKKEMKTRKKQSSS